MKSNRQQVPGPGPSSRVPLEHRKQESISEIPAIEYKFDSGSLTDAATQLKQAELIAMLLSENERLKRELYRSNKRASYLGHEMRGVLDAISAGVADIESSALHSEHSLSGDELHGEVGRIRTAVRSMSLSLTDGQDLATEHLDIDALEAGKKQIKVLPLREFLQEIIQSFVPKARIKNKTTPFELKLDMQGGELWIKSDKKALTRIFKNLISNAMKFTMSGSITLIVKQKPSADSEQLALDIWVKDTGCGMSAEARTRLFQAFSQVHDTDTLDVGGTGLGLTYVKDALNYLGAKVDVISQPNAGTTFCLDFSFPKVSKEEELPYFQQKTKTQRVPSISVAPSLFISRTQTPEPVQVIAPAKQLNILIVEDNLVNSKIYLKHLTSLGHHGVSALNGLEAVEKFKNSKLKFDIIFMDLNMPIKGGLEASREIRLWEAEQNKEAKNDESRLSSACPIILLSGNAYSTVENEAVAAGITDHLLKGTANLKAKFAEMIELWVKPFPQKNVEDELVNQAKEADKDELPLFSLPSVANLGIFSDRTESSLIKTPPVERPRFTSSRKVHPEPSALSAQNEKQKPAGCCTIM